MLHTLETLRKKEELIKTCLLTHEYPPLPGGVGLSVRRIARLLVELGHEVHVAVIRPAERPITFGRNVESRRDEAIHVHDMFFSPPMAQQLAQQHITVPEQSYAAYHGNIEVFLSMQDLHHREHFDLFHGFFLSNVGQLTTFLGKWAAKPSIVSIRGNDIGKNIFLNEHLPRLRYTLENATFVTSVSQDLLQAAHTIYPFSRGVVINNSFDQSRLLQWPRIPRPHPGLVIGCVGIFRFKKGVPLLLEALKHVRLPAQWSLLLVGDFQNVHERAYHEAFLAEFPYRDHVHLTGLKSQEQVFSYLEHMDICVAPSLFSEGCPNAALEAMAMGVPVVVSDAGALGEVVVHEQTGLVYRQSSVSALGQELQRLVDDVELRERLGKSGKEAVLSRHGTDRERAEWQSVYQQVLDVR